jgi:sec-independent protein translocase protein TatC
MKQHKSDKQSFSGHLAELRVRFFYVGISLGIGSVIGYQFYSQLIKFLLHPLNQTVYYTSPVGGLNFVFQISLLFGFLFSLPVFVYNLFRFIAPALPPHIEKKIFPFTLSASILMIIGISFAYFIGLPAALHFLSGFVSGDVHSLINVNDYFSFVTKYLIGFGLLFQLPLLLLFINYIKPLSTKLLLQYQRHSIVLALVIGMFLSPAPDPLNMAIMAIPLVLLYYTSIVMIALMNKKKQKNLDKAKSFNAEAPPSLLANIFSFVIITIVSALFGLSLLFSYATYENIQAQKPPFHLLIPVPESSFHPSLKGR